MLTMSVSIDKTYYPLYQYSSKKKRHPDIDMSYFGEEK